MNTLCLLNCSNHTVCNNFRKQMYYSNNHNAIYVSRRMLLEFQLLAVPSWNQLLLHMQFRLGFCWNYNNGPVQVNSKTAPIPRNVCNIITSMKRAGSFRVRESLSTD